MVIILYVLLFLSPLIMIGIGFSWRKNISTKINVVYGYRTKYSMKSQETWDYAHRAYGKYMRIAGLILLIITLLFSIPFFLLEKDSQTLWTIVILFIQIIIFIALIFPVEYRLRKKFDKNGNLKKKRSLLYSMN